MDPRTLRADTVVVQDGRITAVGEKANLSSMYTGKPQQILDCRGNTLLPGFIDAHCHIQAYAKSLVILNLDPEQGVHAIPDIQAAVQKQAQGLPTGQWIRAQGYHEFDLQEKRHPNRWDLDTVSPDHPVRIAHRTGHAHVLNSLALKRVGLSKGLGKV